MSTLNELIEANQFLQLPRLSSQPVFDSLCPPESSKSRRRLCVLLISGKGGVDSADEDGRRQALREFIADTRFSKDRVRFAYVLEDKQADFVKSLINSIMLNPICFQISQCSTLFYFVRVSCSFCK